VCVNVVDLLGVEAEADVSEIAEGEDGLTEDLTRFIVAKYEVTYEIHEIPRYVDVVCVVSQVTFFGFLDLIKRIGDVIPQFAPEIEEELLQLRCLFRVEGCLLLVQDEGHQNVTDPNGNDARVELKPERILSWSVCVFFLFVIQSEVIKLRPHLIDRHRCHREDLSRPQVFQNHFERVSVSVQEVPPFFVSRRQ